MNSITQTMSTSLENNQTVNDTEEIVDGPVTIDSKNYSTEDGDETYIDRTSIIVRFARVGLNGQPIIINGGERD